MYISAFSHFFIHVPFTIPLCIAINIVMFTFCQGGVGGAGASALVLNDTYRASMAKLKECHHT